jgi:hypothetical protein
MIQELEEEKETQDRNAAELKRTKRNAMQLDFKQGRIGDGAAKQEQERWLACT